MASVSAYSIEPSQSLAGSTAAESSVETPVELHDDAAHEYSEYVKSQKNVIKVQKWQTIEQLHEIVQLKHHWRNTILIVLMLIGGIGIIILSDFLSLSAQYPKVFCWFRRIGTPLERNDKFMCHGKSAHFIRYPDPYLMGLSMAYPAMSSMLNSFCIIPYTDPRKSHFLMMVIQEFADILTPPMLLASDEMQLQGPNGENLVDTWLPASVIYDCVVQSKLGQSTCTSIGLDNTQTHVCNLIKCAMKKRWNKSCKQGNPFYNCFFVNSKSEDSFGDFMSVRSVSDYVQAVCSDGGDASSAQGFTQSTHLYTLYTYGFAALADRLDSNPYDFLNYMFTPIKATTFPPRFVPDCANEGLYAGLQAGVGIGMGAAGASTAMASAQTGLAGAIFAGGFLAAGTIAGAVTGTMQASAVTKNCKENLPEPTKPLHIDTCCAPNPCKVCSVDPSMKDTWDAVAKKECNATKLESSWSLRKDCTKDIHAYKEEKDACLTNFEPVTSTCDASEGDACP